MSSTTRKTNLETVTDAYDAFGRGAIEEVLAAMDEEVEWIEPEGWVDGGTYRGPQQVLEGAFAPLAEDWDPFALEPERFLADDDTVVVTGTFHGTSVETGKRFESPFVHVLDLEDGRIVRFQEFADTALLNEALAE